LGLQSTTSDIHGLVGELSGQLLNHFFNNLSVGFLAPIGVFHIEFKTDANDVRGDSHKLGVAYLQGLDIDAAGFRDFGLRLGAGA
jgi:hypothetical protein